ncbi:MFS transporter [Treponema lecithinolyticum]|uniref:Signal peptide protein, YSIRK family n=1 Tax=Treponema lecithinolyticum ATCC 700332 TaxID=1321815 RepID=A0ABN0NX81_TRELE|nr:MFS transporter [Treponema lecithinolyticum]ERJ91985.1 signal peptide protein, YSIRK family [Treponema lecithinolyticum ATCC 700332]
MISLQELDKLPVAEKIRYAHQIRKNLMHAVMKADRKTAQELQIFFYYFIKNADLGILKRTGDTLRALKNIMLSYNSLYAYQAEEGGLDAVTAHYKAERYAVMFERAASESEIRAVYKECFEDYIDGAQRILVKTSGDISERVLEYINKKFTDQLSIEEIATVFHVNSSYLMRKFKKETGKRNDGSLYSIYTFSRKIGSTLASVGVSGILAAIGFVSSAAVQSEQVVANIRRLGTGVPFLAVILEIIGMTFIWNLSKEKTEEIQKALSERNEG